MTARASGMPIGMTSGALGSSEGSTDRDGMTWLLFEVDRSRLD